MAKYSVTRVCGHDEIVNLIGKMKDREWRLNNVEPNKLCAECYQVELNRQREEVNRQTAEAAKDMNLPELEGSEKQVAWAETLRQKFLDKTSVIYVKNEKYNRKEDEKERQKYILALESIKATKTKASWWIDTRFSNMYSLLEDEAEQMKKVAIAPPRKVVDDAKIEANVRPENPVTETVAEIHVLENAIEIHFPEKLENFRKMMRNELGMEWTGSSWKRKLTPINGTPADRGAEAGHRLLAAGFPIRIFDEGIRNKAISGNYEPECTRWILKRITGEYSGWFAISWDKDKVVPPAKPENVVITGRPPVLEVPIEVSIDESLRDEN